MLTYTFWTANDLPLEEFGFLLASSIGNSDQTNLDWALIEITQHKLDNVSTFELVNGPGTLVILQALPLNADVFAHTASHGTLNGKLSSMSNYVLLPGSPIFQEVWTVRFETGLGEAMSLSFSATYSADLL